MPKLRSLPRMGKRCQELRVIDADVTWRIYCRLDPDAVLILEVCAKKTVTTPRQTIAFCQRRLREYDDESG